MASQRLTAALSHDPCRAHYDARVSEPYEQAIRLDVFDHLRRLASLDPEGLINRADLDPLLLSNGGSVHVIGAAGIWKPRGLRYPISVTTIAPKPGHPPPYDDTPGPDGTIVYRYRGTDPGHPDNVAMRDIMRLRLPIAYFKGIEPGRYRALFPTFIVGDDPSQLAVTLDIAAGAVAETGMLVGDGPAEALRRYAIRAVRQRLHQDQFRSMVLHAYRCRCAVCSLKRRPLLDAAHIVEDADPDGIAAITNGLSLCKIHHAAYDRNFLGIDPDLTIHIAKDLLDEIDGPMLQHGLKSMHGKRLATVPARIDDRPDRDRLRLRFEAFRRAQ
jgi:putative restriction endonuclease